MNKLPLLIAVLIFVLIALTGCNEAGKEPSEPDANEVENSFLKITELIADEWKSSGHSYGIVAAADRGIGCARCHDGVGFADQLEYTDKPFEPPHQTGIDCQACHTGFGKERMDTGIVELPFMAEPLEAGLGAVCAACHNSNRNPSQLFAQSEAGELERYTYPHYGMNASLLSGRGGMEIPGAEYIISIAHANIEDSCVACHMPETQYGYRKHSFKMDIAYYEQTCGGCHIGESDTFNLGGLQDEIKAMLDQLELAILESTGASRIDTGGGVFIFYDEMGEVMTNISHEAYVATYNWRMVAKDGSYGIHNPLYSKSLLKESYKYLTGNEM